MKWPPKMAGVLRHTPDHPKSQLEAQINSALEIAQHQVCAHKFARPQVDSTPLVCANALPDELWVLTRPLGSNDPIWGEQTTIIGSPERIRSMFDLSAGVPWPWRLLKNKKARRFLRAALKEELRYRRDKSAREKAGEN